MKSVTRATFSAPPSSVTPMICDALMASTRSAHSTSSRVGGGGAWVERSRPRSAATCTAPSDAGAPGAAATPADFTATCFHARRSASLRAIAIASGLRHVLPVHTKRRLYVVAPPWSVPRSSGLIDLAHYLSQFVHRHRAGAQ